ncbi:MAG: SufE family protein, partial [Pseudomonadota bacterium]
MAQPDFEEIVDTFEFLEDWEDRYRHVIDMGKEMPEMPEAL